MGLFDWFKSTPDAPDMFPDIKRVPVDPGMAAILAEYDSRSAGEVLALCLEGGGAKGRWQAGFMARLAESGVLKRVNVGAGTSVGGLGITVIARYREESPDMQALVDIWRGISKNSVIYLGEMPSDFWSLAKALIQGKISAPSLLDTTPLQALVKKHLDGYTSFKLPVYVVTTDYMTKKGVVLGPGSKATDMALSTSAVPGAFPAWNGRYMDGGCAMNCPYPFLIDEQKATKIIVLYCDPDPSMIPVTTTPPTTMNTASAAIDSMMQVQSDRAFDDLEKMSEIRKLKGQDPIEIAHFFPSVPTGTLLDFQGKPELLQQGYDDAVKFLTPEKVKALLAA